MRVEWSKRERVILRELEEKKLGYSHGLDHLENVAKYGLLLAEEYGGKKEIIVAVALLHDLGRSSKPQLHGQKSSAESVRLATPILKNAGYKESEVKLILQCIKEHDQPQFHSKLLESRILKDADFLDGFGMRGILRAAYYTAESGEPLEKVVERLNNKMHQRFRGLEFPLSKQLAEEQYRLVRLNLAYINGLIGIRDSYKGLGNGRLIVFEGISGTGKETQAKLLKRHLEEKGEKVSIVYHPTPRLKQTLKEWRKDEIGGLVAAFLFLADRRDSMLKMVFPALKEGNVVISLRNWLSTLVYQAKTEWEVALISYLYSTFAPRPDVLFYLDLEPEVALERVSKRTKETGEERGKFERLSLLKVKRERYLGLLKHFENVIKIDVEKPIAAIHAEIVQNLK